MQPLATPDDIRIIPKPRYAIMTRYLPTRGALALWMMRTTAGMQVNLDVTSPAEAARKQLRWMPEQAKKCARANPGVQAGTASRVYRRYFN